MIHATVCLDQSSVTSPNPYLTKTKRCIYRTVLFVDQCYSVHVRVVVATSSVP